MVVPVCIDLSPTTVSAFRATVQRREGQGSRRRRLIATCIRSGARVDAASLLRRKELPQATYRHADRTESGEGHGRPEPRPEVTRVFESRCQLGFPRPSSPSAAGTSAPRTQNAQSSLLVQPSAVSWRAASAAARRQGDAGSPSTAGCRLQGRFKADAVHEAPRRKRARARPTGNRVAW